MHCTHFDHSGPQLGDCGNGDFDVHVTAMLTADLSGEESDHTLDLDGFSHEDIQVTCKKCGGTLGGAAAAKAVTVLVLKLEKRHGASLGPFSSYTFEDGTTVDPDSLKVDALQDVAAGPAYQAARKYHEQYRTWQAQQQKRIARGEIDERDLHTMSIPWQASSERHLADLLAELAA
ncbi:hypothetical protein [Streptomyces sp. NPDC001089]